MSMEFNAEVVKFYFILLFNVYLFILREKERQRERELMHMSGAGAEREGERSPRRLLAVSTEPNVGLELMTLEIKT